MDTRMTDIQLEVLTAHFDRDSVLDFAMVYDTLVIRTKGDWVNSIFPDGFGWSNGSKGQWDSDGYLDI